MPSKVARAGRRRELVTTAARRAPGPRLPQQEEEEAGRDLLRPGLEKLVRSHDVEARVDRLQLASEAPPLDVEDPLDPSHPSNEPAWARPESPEPQQSTGRPPHLSAALSVMGDALAFYRGMVYTPDHFVRVRMLLDSGASAWILDTEYDPILGRNFLR
ncbi:uncharacterized protein N7515_004790 [Penicillium bovifimosum]|uniref:Uncharacterized protein n=1 Tax=Penicillium bovifimosum TaxID=126998 RepID=A0A9W9L487_9EURO|nr:uncharacterized protein N7515_004790 [Penicillium bovifimosum]KAJ5135512.1 hypothetical protein N7515_004790 [Penicillium bovifimosum]